MNFPEFVHIVPLGFEIDRAVKLFDKIQANLVYLLITPSNPSYPQENKEQEHYINEVKRKLIEKGIAVEIVEVDLFDIKEVMKNVASLVIREKTKGNDVYVNMSAAGRLTSVGATLAAMAHNAKVYYVQADHYSRSEKDRREHGISICDKLDATILENFQIKLPDNIGKLVLTYLCNKGKAMSTENILNFLISEGVEIFKDEKTVGPQMKRRVQQRNRINLNKVVLDKLDRNGYITREKLGRFNKIGLTESGEYMAHIIGLL